MNTKAARKELPGPLRNAVSDTLDSYDPSRSGPGRKELEVAVARVHAKFRTNINDIAHSGPIAYDGELLVYTVPCAEWQDLCDDIKVYAQARTWTEHVHEHCADRIARSDPYVSLHRVRARYTDDDRYPVVVAHP